MQSAITIVAPRACRATNKCKGVTRGWHQALKEQHAVDFIRKEEEKSIM